MVQKLYSCAQAGLYPLEVISLEDSVLRVLLVVFEILLRDGSYDGCNIDFSSSRELLVQ